MAIILIILQAWVFKAPMPTPRYGFGIGTIGDCVYIIGGRNNFSQLNIVECYHTLNDSWSINLAPMPTARYYVGSAVYNSKIYVIGGRRMGGGGITGRVERYDPTTNAWDTCPPMPTPREGLTAVLYRNRIFAIGGYTPQQGGRYLRTVESFDPLTTTWHREDSLIFARAGTASSVLFDTIYVICGSQFSPLNNIERYGGSGWTLGTALNRGRVGPTSALFNDSIYVCGGEAAPESVYNSVEIYDQINRTWVFTWPMNQARSHHSSTVAAGYLYVFGGRALSNTIASTEALRLTNIQEREEKTIENRFFIPSPVRSRLLISSREPKVNCQIFDVAGRLLVTRSIASGQSLIDLAPGIYFVRLFNRQTILIKKVIIIR